MDTGTTIQTIPNWYLGLTTALIVVILLLFMGLIVLVLELRKVAMRLEPKVTGLLSTVNDDLVPQVKGLVTKVDALTTKVDGIADSAKGTVESVGGSARSLANSIETFATSGLKRFEAATPLIGFAIAGFKLFGLIQELRGKKTSAAKANAKSGTKSVVIHGEKGDSEFDVTLSKAQ